MILSAGSWSPSRKGVSVMVNFHQAMFTYIEAISAIESMQLAIPKQTAKNIHIAPAVPPFVSERLPVLSRALISKPTALAIGN